MCAHTSANRFDIADDDPDYCLFMQAAAQQHPLPPDIAARVLAILDAASQTGTKTARANAIATIADVYRADPRARAVLAKRQAAAIINTVALRAVEQGATSDPVRGTLRLPPHLEPPATADGSQQESAPGADLT
jgi:hypothetical protein